MDAMPPFPGRFCVGVTGHRAHRLGDGRAVADTAQSLLHRIGRLAGVAAAECPAFGPSTFRPVLSGAMADGADQIVAQAARAAGFTLEAILPFPAEPYSRPFPPAARAAVLALAGDPEVEAVMTVADLGADAPEPAMALAYRRAGEAMLDRADLLVAVWDGAPPRGPGGTGEIVARARAMGRPVAWIGLDGALRLALGTGPWGEADPERLDQAIRARLLPQAPMPAPGPALPPEDWGSFIAGAAALHGPGFARGLAALKSRADHARALGLALAPLLSAARLPLLIGARPGPASDAWDDWALRMAVTAVPLPPGVMGPDRLRGILDLAATLTEVPAFDLDWTAVEHCLRRGEVLLRRKAPR